MPFQLLYISSATRPMLPTDIESILASARRFNKLNEITGLLISSSTHFMQVLEGNEGVVRETYARICTDPRHHAHVVLRETDVDTRQFGDWTMSSHILSDTALTGAIDDVSAAVAECNVITSAYLLGFADRAKAA